MTVLIVGIEFEAGSSFTIIVRTPDDLFKAMLQEGTNFIKPDTPVIVVKQLTKKTVSSCITAILKSYSKIKLFIHVE